MQEREPDQLRVLSLGWGVQSWTIAAMSALEELPRLDLAIHADTTFEHQATYKFARQWTPWLEARGVKVVRVGDARQAGRITTDKTDIPAFTINHHTGSLGQLRRQCTGRLKIQPIRRFIRAIQQGSRVRPLEHRFVTAWNHRVNVFDYLRICEAIEPFARVEQWLGISLDEIERARDSDVGYLTHQYPLLDKRMSRADCVTWLGAHDPPLPPKSTCIFCPYHNHSAWQELKRQGGLDWEIAVAVDTAIRDRRAPHPLYLHPARLALAEAVTIPEDFGAEQLSLNLTDITDRPCDSSYCFS